MTKINQKEYETLKKMQKKGHKFIARTKEGHVIVFTAYHGKSDSRWLVTTNRDDYKYESLYNSDEIFLFIGWEDEKPYSIAELIKEYEFGKILLAMAEEETVLELEYESEETEMKKNKEWLIKRVENYIPINDKAVGSVVDNILDIIDQLDEPETLTPEWIDERIHYSTDEDAFGNIVRIETIPVKCLQNLLVPKQELPVIPQFVADKLEQSKADGIHSVGVIFHGALNREYDAFLNNWILNNEKLFVEAFFAYPNIEVGEEQKYYVIFPSVDEDSKGFNYLAKDCYHKELWVEDTRTDGLVWEERSSFTEDEIRDLDKGDILFEHFSVNVKELEE